MAWLLLSSNQAAMLHSCCQVGQTTEWKLTHPCFRELFRNGREFGSRISEGDEIKKCTCTRRLARTSAGGVLRTRLRLRRPSLAGHVHSPLRFVFAYFTVAILARS